MIPRALPLELDTPNRCSYRQRTVIPRVRGIGKCGRKWKKCTAHFLIHLRRSLRRQPRTDEAEPALETPHPSADGESVARGQRRLSSSTNHGGKIQVIACGESTAEEAFWSKTVNSLIEHLLREAVGHICGLNYATVSRINPCRPTDLENPDPSTGDQVSS